MTRKFQILRGTEAQNDAFTGAVGELTMDTTNNEIRIHDGSTVGGHKIGGTIRNQNTAAGATNPIYDWVGTLAEYTAQNIATTHPGWLCYITDDNTAQAFDAYSKTESDARYVQQGHQVIEFQEPTAANNYTWYRLYDDGWVEQGGEYTGNAKTITLPVVMATNKYQVAINKQSSPSYWASTNLTVGSLTTTSFSVIKYGDNASMDISWQVSGMAA